LLEDLLALPLAIQVLEASLAISSRVKKFSNTNRMSKFEETKRKSNANAWRCSASSASKNIEETRRGNLAAHFHCWWLYAEIDARLSFIKSDRIP
jgi:hypothetical protein